MTRPRTKTVQMQGMAGARSGWVAGARARECVCGGRGGVAMGGCADGEAKGIYSAGGTSKVS